MPQHASEDTHVDLIFPMVEEIQDTASAIQASEEDDKGPKWKGKQVATPSIVLHTPASSSIYSLESDEEDGQVLDLTQYDPPAPLLDTQYTDSEIIVDIIQRSIEQVRNKINEEQERQKKVAEDVRRLEEERLAQMEKEVVQRGEESSADPDEDKKSSTNPDEITEQNIQAATPSVPRYHRVEPTASTTFAGVKFTMDENGLLRPVSSSKSRKRSLFGGLLRRLNNTEKGESSVQGASRHKQSSSIDYSFLTTNSLSLTKKLATNHTPPESTHEEEIECVSCLDDFPRSQTVQVPCHSYCTSCFHRLIWTACENEQQWPPKCCLNTIPKPTILSGIHGSGELQQTYEAKSEEWSLPVGDRIYCNQSICAGVFVRPENINLATRLARCGMGHYICVMCRGPEHGNEACPQDRDLQRTQELAEEEGWKRCHQCGVFVEHREACQHMTCRCGAQFCYVCGARWRTCGCTMEQLYAVKQEAAARRQVREAREAEEEAEIAEALRLVEEFEREEAMKATLLRLERERVERLRKEKEIRAKLHKEYDRRKAVEVKFRELRQELADLHEIQRVDVVREHGKTENILRFEADCSMAKLKEQNTRGREAMVVESRTRLLELEAVLEGDYAARVKLEQDLEEEYESQLSAYWADKEDGEMHMEDALAALKRRMDKGHRVWRNWMCNELETQKFLDQEDLSINMELMDEAEKRLAVENDRQYHAFVVKRRAERNWVELAVEERDSMLSGMEIEEVGQGDDTDALLALLAEMESDESRVVDDLEEYRMPGSFR